jgi:hypothetical protein
LLRGVGQKTRPKSSTPKKALKSTQSIPSSILWEAAPPEKSDNLAQSVAPTWGVVQKQKKPRPSESPDYIRQLGSVAANCAPQFERSAFAELFLDDFQ